MINTVFRFPKTMAKDLETGGCPDPRRADFQREGCANGGYWQGSPAHCTASCRGDVENKNGTVPMARSFPGKS